MASPAHRANLLVPSRREIGAGVVYGSPRAGEGEGVVAGDLDRDRRLPQTGLTGAG